MPSAGENVKNQIKKITKWDFEGTLKMKKNSENFDVDKQGRFAARFFQIGLAIMSYYFIGQQDNGLMKKYGLVPTKDAVLLVSALFLTLNRIFAIFSPLISGGLLALWLAPWCGGRRWNSRRIVLIELFVDLCMTVAWFGIFISQVAATKGDCASVSPVDGCTAFNWLSAWIFFLFLGWGTGLFLDVTALKQGLFSPNEADVDVMMDVRRATRAGRQV